jgi:hypothetical protein
MIKYRTDRASDYAKMTWTGTPYTLQAILAAGGICVDQAYFASEAGKARGIPTLLFTGFGPGRPPCLVRVPGRRAQMAARRRPLRRAAAGDRQRLDPQTWMEMSDHDLEFLSERFRALPSFMQSRVNEEFAADFLQPGRRPGRRGGRPAPPSTTRGATSTAWETLIAADAALGRRPPGRGRPEGGRARLHAEVPRPHRRLREQGLREPARARRDEPRQLRGARPGGQAEGRPRRPGDHPGLRHPLPQHRDPVAPGPDSATYNAILAQFGHGAGTMFFDQIVVAFAEHLAMANQKPAARAAVESARQALDVQPGTQSAMEVDKLLEKLQD